MIDDKTLKEMKEGFTKNAKDSIKDVMKDIKRVESDEVLRKKIENQLKDLGINDEDGNETSYGKGYRDASMSMLRFAILQPEGFRRLCTAMALSFAMDLDDAQRLSELIKEDE